MPNYPAGGGVYPPKADFFGDNGKMEKLGDNARKGSGANGTVPDETFPPPNLGSVTNS